MKRSNEQQQTPEEIQDESNKKPRYTPSYGDMYAQYAMYPHYAATTAASYVAPEGTTTPTPAPTTPYTAYTQPVYYNAPGQYYPQQFVAPVYPPMPADAPRTIYLGNVSADMTAQDILAHVHCGLVDSFRIVPEKTCAFLTFVEPISAQIFYAEYMTKKLIILNIELKVGWGKPNPMPALHKTQIQTGATRNVYFGNLDPDATEESLREAVKEYGDLESVRIIPEKSIGFVHFLSISSAIQCITMLPSEPAWQNKKISFGRDHCADGTEQYRAMGFGIDLYGQYTAVTNATGNCQRTLYLGGLAPEATCEDICNAIRGGNLLQVKLIQEKHIAFVTFFDAATAQSVYNHLNSSVVTIKGKRFRVGWGKASSITSQIALAVNGGATRNVYIGGIDENTTAEQLRADFSEYGEIELINIHKEKSCAFVNFTSVQSAMAALIGARRKHAYVERKLNYGKDRCGNPFKAKPKKEKVAKEEVKPVVAQLTEANLLKFTAQQPAAKKKINI